MSMKPLFGGGVDAPVSLNDLPTLYCYDSKGKARQWDVRAEDGNVIVSYGAVGGKIVEKVTKSKPKNKGKSNATTPETQSVLEALAKHRFQIEREDYHQDIEWSGLQLRPMLALDYNKVPHRVDWLNAYAQPKLDGLRLTVGNRIAIHQPTREFKLYDSHALTEMLTRKGETYHMPHMIEHTDVILARVNELVDGRCIALDGEAYLHGLPLQKITSRARKYKKGLTEELEFHMFDLVIPGMNFLDRHAVLTEALLSSDVDPRILQLVEYNEIANYDEMYEMHGVYVENGYEGLMIRHGNGDYGVAMRSPDLFKFKLFFDDQFKIIDMWEDDNGNAMLTCEIFEGQVLSCTHDGDLEYIAPERIEFNCTPKRTHEERKHMLTEPENWIGGWIKVKYQGLTVDGSLQFPVGLEKRECDDSGNPLV